ncbi:vancomycin high temperature exclusion protein [Arsenicicoccus dermatophilus]|uniref:SanA/YdcF family protein n=1 Tax=Arsenicicoccus dermatophilus TaxID=1076331 RepID=UPI0039171596
MTGQERRSARHTTRIVVGTLGLGALTAVVGTRAWALLASRGRILDPADAPVTEAAVVLGAGLRPDGRPSDYLAARLDRALELHRLGRAPLLVVSGAALPDADEPAAMRRYLQERGVDPAVVVEDRAGIDTYATCLRARRTFGLHRIALVSQAYHLPRALALADAAGLDAVGVADRSVRRHEDTELSTWVHGELREWAAGVKVLADLVRSRPEDDGPYAEEGD